jgi:hypothetical protein
MALPFRKSERQRDDVPVAAPAIGQRRKRTSFAMHAAHLASHFMGLIQKGSVPEPYSQ